MKRFYLSTALAVTVMLVLAGTAITKDDYRGRVKAELNGYQEAPPVSTTGTGDFQAKLNDARTALDFELSYENLNGSGSGSQHLLWSAGGNWWETGCDMWRRKACVSGFTDNRDNHGR